MLQKSAECYCISLLHYKLMRNILIWYMIPTKGDRNAEYTRKIIPHVKRTFPQNRTIWSSVSNRIQLGPNRLAIWVMGLDIPLNKIEHYSLHLNINNEQQTRIFPRRRIKISNCTCFSKILFLRRGVQILKFKMTSKHYKYC
jgi:hypothetical protein